MASSSAEWKHVSAFVSIFWLSSIVSIASTQDIKVTIYPSGTAHYGENMTLLCAASSSRTMKIKKLIWVKNNIMCKYAGNKTDLQGPCEIKNETSLILNLINITQEDEGDYICKLTTNEGIADANYTVTIQAYPITTPPDIDLERVINPTPTDSSGSFWLSMCTMVGIVMVNLMMYC